jgi:hypothetical protein
MIVRRHNRQRRAECASRAVQTARCRIGSAAWPFRVHLHCGAHNVPEIVLSGSAIMASRLRRPLRVHRCGQGRGRRPQPRHRVAREATFRVRNCLSTPLSARPDLPPVIAPEPSHQDSKLCDKEIKGRRSRMHPIKRARPCRRTRQSLKD